MNGTNYEVLHCGAFSTPHSHLSWVQIFALGPIIILMIMIIIITMITMIIIVTIIMKIVIKVKLHSFKRNARRTSPLFWMNVCLLI